MTDLNRCYACGRIIKPGATPNVVDTRDDQTVWVGPECAVKVYKAGEVGYQPPKGGPRLYPMPEVK